MRHQRVAGSNDRGSLQGLISGRAVQQDQIVLPRDAGKQFGQGQLRSVTILLGLGSKESRSIIEMGPTGNDIKVGPNTGSPGAVPVSVIIVARARGHGTVANRQATARDRPCLTVDFGGGCGHTPGGHS